MKTTTKDHYDQKYSDWTINDSSLKKAIKEDTIVLNSLMSLCPCDSTKRVLELGGGIGYKSQILFELGYDVTSLELSEVAIEKAKSWWSNQINFICGDFTKIDLQKKFDIVYSSSFSPLKYEFKKPNSEVLSTMFSLVKPGGFFVFEWGRNSSFEEKHRQWGYIKLAEIKKILPNYGTIIGIYAAHRQLALIFKKYYFSSLLTYLTLTGSIFHRKGYRLYAIVRK